MAREHIQQSVEFRFLRIPTEWSIETTASGQLQAVPRIDQSRNRSEVGELDAWELRGKFLRLKRGDERAASEFLREAGVWYYEADVQANRESEGDRLLSGEYASRLLQGRAAPVPLERLWRQVEKWHGLLRDPSKLRAKLRGVPANAAGPVDKFLFSLQTRTINEFHLHFEWREEKIREGNARDEECKIAKAGGPYAVVETVTGIEALMATLHLDLLRKARFQVCKRPQCSIPFPITDRRQREFCTNKCAHADTERRRRAREKKKTRRKGNAKKR